MYGSTVPKPTDLPKVLSQKSARRLLEQNGWVETLGGNHVVKMEKEGHRPITLPTHKRGDYGPSLTGAILKQAGLRGPAVDHGEEG